MITMLQRLCWNTRSWRLPTGSSDEGGFPGKTGYGLEEWNFQVEDVYNGYVYGYSRYTPPEATVKRAEGHFRIAFWTLHPDTRLKLLVGVYHDATLVTPKEARGLHAFFEAEGVFDRRAEELAAVANDLSEKQAKKSLKDAVKDRTINWKCPIGEIEVVYPGAEIPNVISGKTVGSYFTNPTFIDDDVVPRNSAIDGFGWSINQGSTRRLPLSEDGYYRESAQNLRTIIPRHNKLSNEFCEWLKNGGAHDVIQERDQIDVAFTNRGESYRAELKVCYGVGPTKAIREAFGQLLEYNYYVGRKPAEKWLIILDEKPADNDIAYVRRIGSELDLPVRVGWKESSGFVIDNVSTREFR